MVRLVGPGGAGKSTTGALLAERLGVSFIDLDRYFNQHFGNISEFVENRGYREYTRVNVEGYRSSSGFMTYDRNTHPDYPNVRSEVERCPYTYALLPSLDREICVSETVRRQLTRPFARPASREEEVIRARFEVYKTMPVWKVETMKPVDAVLTSCSTR